MITRPVKILGTGKYLPKRKVVASEIDARLGVAPGWTEQRAGVFLRHYIDDESTSQMAVAAIQQALDRADVTLDQIDCIISASATQEQPIPCTASLIQRALGAEDSGIPCLDINSTCLSFVAALDMVSYIIAAGRFRRVLIVSSEIASNGLNWKDKESAALFGDGAAAAVVGLTPEGESSAVLASHMETYSSGAELSQVYGGGTKYLLSNYSEATRDSFLFQMNGRKIFKMTTQLIDDFLDRLFQGLPFSITDVDLVVPHQASNAAMTLMQKRLGVPPERFVNIVRDHGNTIAASIPMALHEGILQGRLQRGERVLLLGTSAGLSLGGILLEY